MTTMHQATKIILTSILPTMLQRPSPAYRRQLERRQSEGD